MAKTTNRGRAVDVGLNDVQPAKAMFSRRLYQAMVRKGWSQSELARNADLPRDAVSVYIRGKSLPTPLSLRKLAKALDINPDELLPPQMMIERDRIPVFEIKATEEPNIVLLRVNQEVPLATALKIAEMLNEKASA